MDATVDMQGMLNQAAVVEDNPESAAERVQREVSEAFATADFIHECCLELGDDDDAGVEEVGNMLAVGVAQDGNFDA